MADSVESTDEKDRGWGDEEGIPLRTMRHVEAELARVYRDLKFKREEVGRAAIRMQILQGIAKVKTGSMADELLKRMEELESRQARAEESAGAH